MTPRERMIAAIQHREPDRVPITMDFNRSTAQGIMNVGGPSALERIMKHLGVETEEELRVRLGHDLRDVQPAWKSQDEWKDKEHCGWGPALRQVRTMADFRRLWWPSHDQVWDYSSFERDLEEVLNLPQEYLVRGPGPQFWELYRGWLGMVDALILLKEDPELAQAMMRKIMDIYVDRSVYVMENWGDHIDMQWGGDDLGMQDRLMMSPETFRDVLKPVYLEGHRRAKSVRPCYLHFHCCGSIPEIIGDLIETGVDVLHPIQPKARGMDRRVLKQQYGDRLTFHGNVDTQEIMAFGTPEQVRAETLECFRALGQGGGHILAPSHTIQPNMPVENVMAFFDTALNECWY
ncbi:MAG: uroporphyrinogen decarboxylase family protein [Anaerolineae bacterium]